MPRINVIIDDALYLKIIKVKSQIQTDNPMKNIDFSYAVRFVLNNGLS